eukprot:Skav225123  [mRNA]  locus=scaffold1239:313913:321795:+ [translate_table: standard]
MAQVQKQLAASQQFLSGLRDLPRFNELCASQVTRLVSVIQKNGLTTAEAAHCLDSLKEDLWSADALNELKAALAANIKDELPGGPSRVLQQDYTALPHYLDQDMWNCLEQSPDEKLKLERLRGLAASLGLKSPTEGTNGCLVFLALYVPQNHGLLESEKYDKLQKKKAKIKGLLKSLSVSANGLDTLPPVVTECPSGLMAAAYPKGFTSGSPSARSMADILRSIRDYPLRSTHTMASVETHSRTVNSMAGSDPNMASVASAVAVGMAVAKQALGSERSSVPPSLDIQVFDRVAKPPAGTYKMLPIEDVKPVVPEASGTTKDPEKLILALKDDLSAEKHDDRREDEDEDDQTQPPKDKALRRPAASKSAAKKRPAASGSSVGRGTGSMKRPASSSPPSIRDRLMATIPLNLKKKYRFDIVALLNSDEKQTGAYVGKNRRVAYPNACVALGTPLLIDSRKFPCLSVAKVVQHKVNSCHFFKACLQEALRSSPDGLDIVVFWDESVPGNVLAPDLRRKSGLTYFSFLQLPVLWRNTCWMTLAVARSQDLQSLPEGYTRYVTAVLQNMVTETKDGFMVEIDERPTLVRLRRLLFLADADGIRLGLGNKGAAGLKPCFRCANVVSGNHTDLNRHHHISSSKVECWSQHSVEDVRSIHAHLANLRVKARREEAEKLLGWKLSAMKFNCFLTPALASHIDILDVLYDPMHCFASNGICCQEIGLWFAAVKQKSGKRIDLNKFRDYATGCWTTTKGSNVDIANLLANKNWHEGKDFRGDASATLSILPLRVAFSEEIVFPLYPNLLPEIGSLRRLNAVVLLWQRIKRNFSADHVELLREAQRKHAEAFVAAYGKEEARPKLHFSLHFPQQFTRHHRAIDAFPCERKNSIFKTQVALKRARLTGFDTSCLLEMHQQDLKMAETDLALHPHLRGEIAATDILARVFPHSNVQLAHGIQQNGLAFQAGQFKVLADDLAIQILGACQIDHEFFIVAQRFTLLKLFTAGFAGWKSFKEISSLLLAPLNIVQLADVAVFQRKLYKETEVHVSLLMG